MNEREFNEVSKIATVSRRKAYAISEAEVKEMWEAIDKLTMVVKKMNDEIEALWDHVHDYP